VARFSNDKKHWHRVCALVRIISHIKPALGKKTVNAANPVIKYRWKSVSIPGVETNFFAFIMIFEGKILEIET
jgi:hypothetical protein